MQSDFTPLATVAVALPSVLQRLRFETQSAHASIEESLALTDKKLSLGTYQQVLENFYGFYKPVECAIAAANMPAWLDASARSKTAWLEADLQRLGLMGPSAVPLCSDLPLLGTLAQRLGCQYVMEGATLGGMLISRHIRETLGVYPESGGSFFHGYGALTAAMWSDFRAGLLSFAAVAPHQQDEVVASAKATFKALQRWCEMKVKHER
jgi:heme oxygenase (biliverdin-IX-beta and delta-forming)